MRVCILAAAERSASSALDSAMVDGAALASALHRAGHDVELSTLPAPDDSWFNRGLAALETANGALATADAQLADLAQQDAALTSVISEKSAAKKDAQLRLSAARTTLRSIAVASCPASRAAAP
jgi:hypothetical protein